MAWMIDPAHTSVGFNVRHLGLSTVRGEFARFSGEIELDPQDLTKARGRAQIETASVTTGNNDRDAHLRSADFFDAERFPTMTFEIKRVEGKGDNYSVVGDLTIKDVTREVELRYEHAGEATDPFGNHKVGGSLTGSINRRDFGLTWNAPLEAGGWLVADKVNLVIDGQLAESKKAVEQEVAAETASR